MKKSIKMIITATIICMMSMMAQEANSITDFEYDFNKDNKTLCIKSYKGTSKTVVFPAEIKGMKVTKIGNGSPVLPVDESVDNIVMGRNLPDYYNHTVTSVVIPEGIEIIGDSAFLRATKLKSIHLPNTLKEIGIEAFEKTGLEKIVIPVFVEKLINFGRFTPGIFSDCKSLKSVTLPETLTVIAGNTFSGCTSLTDINIPASIKEIGNWAFGYCPLTNLTIPDSVKAIEFGDYAYIGSQLPLEMRNRLMDLGYTGKF